MNEATLEPMVERLDRIARLLERNVVAMEQASRPPVQPAPYVGGVNESLWNAKQAAEFLHCSVSKIYKAAEANKLPCVRDGRSLRFKPSEIRAHVESLRRRASSAIPLR